MVLKAWTGKKDKAATMKITAKVMALNVTESVFNVPDVLGNILLARQKPGDGNLADDRDETAQNEDNAA